MTRWAMRPTMRRIVVLVGGLRPPARSCAHCRANGGHGRPHGRGSRHDPSRPTRHRLSRARSGRITPRGGGSREQRRYHSRRADRSFPCCRWGPCDDGPTPCAHPRNVGLFIARRFVGEDRRAVDRVRGMAGMTKDTRPRRPVQGIADAGESCGIPVCCPQLPRYRPAMTGRARRVPGHRPVDLFYGYCGKNLLGLLRFRILLYARIMYRGPPHRGSCPFAQGNTREASQCWLGGTIRLHTG